MRAEANANVKRSIEVECNGWAVLMHGFPHHADIEGNGVTMFVNANASDFEIGRSVGIAARQSNGSKAIFEILEACALFRAPCQMDHAGSMLSRHGFFGIVVQVLANHQHRLTVVETLWIGKGNIGRKRNIPRHLGPEIAKLVARVPDVVSGGSNRVLLCTWVVTGAAGHDGGANVRLALKDTDRLIEVFAGAMKIRRGRHLLMRR